LRHLGGIALGGHLAHPEDHGYQRNPHYRYQYQDHFRLGI